jgi:hypothetical protein
MNRMLNVNMVYRTNQLVRYSLTICMGQDMYLMILFLFLSNLLLFSYFILSKTKTFGFYVMPIGGIFIPRDGVEELIMV